MFPVDRSTGKFLHNQKSPREVGGRAEGILVSQWLAVPDRNLSPSGLS